MKYVLIGISFILLGSCAFVTDKSDIPSFNLLQIDSTTIFNTKNIKAGKPIVLIYFSPDCEHCQEETAGILKSMDSLKNVQFYFITEDPLERLKVFYKYYHIDRYSNIFLGQDYQPFFRKNLNQKGITPYLLIYNHNRKLKAVYPGGTVVHNLIKTIQDIEQV